jgi:hypothetical protein
MRFQVIIRRVLLGALFAACSSFFLRADPYVVVSPAPNVIFPSGGQYIFGGTFVLSTPIAPQVGVGNIVVSDFTGGIVTVNGPNYVESANAIFTAILSIAGVPAFAITGTGQMNATLNNARPSAPGGPGSADDPTQMTSMDLTGSGGGNTVEITLDAANPSDGQEATTSIGGGLFDISSFFDIFADISLNGGPAVPADAPNVMTLSAPDTGATLPLALISVVLLGLTQRRAKLA